MTYNIMTTDPETKWSKMTVLKDISISLGSFATVFVLLYLAGVAFEFFAG